MHAHQFHHHLIGICRAVKGASARAVIRAELACQQSIAPHFALGKKLARAGFFFVADAAFHRAGRHKNGGQMSARQRAYHQPRDDFIAHAKQQRAVKHLMRQPNGGAHRNHIARKQRQFHALVALCDAIAHRGRAAGHLRGCAVFLHLVFNPIGKIFKRLVRRHHVVIRANHADIGHIGLLHLDLDGFGHGGITVRQVGAAEPVALHFALFDVLPDARQIRFARGAAALDDAAGDFGEFGVERGHGLRLSFCFVA